MKKLLIAAVAIAVSAPALAADYVKGYTRRDGTYVSPHWKTSPDSSRWNNYSTQGNVNPYSGRVGTVSPMPSYQPYRYQAPQPSYPTYRPRYSAPQTEAIYDSLGQ